MQNNSISSQTDIANITVVTEENQIIVPQPITNVIEVNNPGPVGPVGPQGIAGPSGSTQPFSNISGNIWATTSSLQVSGSFLISGSSTFTNIGPAIFSGSVNSQGGFTGSLQGTASYATQALTASFALTSAGGGAAFPYTGSAIITGSLIITGSTTSTSGFTGSLLGTSSYATQALTASFALNSGGGGVTSVTGTAPVVSSGGTTPAISMAAATTSVNGYLTSTNFNTFNGKQAALVSGTNIKTVNGNTLLGSGDLVVGSRSGVEVYQSGLTQNQYQAATGSGNTIVFGSSYPLTVSTNGNIIKISAMFQATQTVVATRLRVYLSASTSSLSGAVNIGNFDISAANAAAGNDTVLYEKTFRLFIDVFNGSYSIGGVDPFITTIGNDFTPQGLNYSYVGDTTSIYYPYIVLVLNQAGVLHTATINYSR